MKGEDVRFNRATHSAAAGPGEAAIKSTLDLQQILAEHGVAVGRALEQLVQSVAQGQVTPDDAEMIANVLKIRVDRLRDEDVERQSTGSSLPSL